MSIRRKDKILAPKAQTLEHLTLTIALNSSNPNRKPADIDLEP